MIISNLVYEDAPAAIEWLCNTFGLTKKMVVPGENNTIAHAQLSWDDHYMVMISSERTDGDLKLRSPKGLEGYNSQGIYVVIDDVASHYDRVKAAGAEIIRPLVNQDYGGAGYTCLDCEGNIWSFGSYDPRSANSS